MQADDLVEAYRAAGFTCCCTASTAWLLSERKVALSVPTLSDIQPAPEEIDEVLAKGAWVARFPTRGVLSPNCVEFLFDRQTYGFGDVAQKARNQTRRGLERCVVHQAGVEDILVRGLEINRTVLARQRRDSAFLLDRRRWERYVRVFLALPDVTAFVATVDGVVAAYVVLMKIVDRIVLTHPFLDRTYQSAYPLNALVFSSINEFRATVGPMPVSYGFGSIWNIGSLDHFKYGMGFAAVPRLRVAVFARPMELVLNRRLARVLAASRLGHSRIISAYARLVEESVVGRVWRRSPVG